MTNKIKLKMKITERIIRRGWENNHAAENCMQHETIIKVPPFKKHHGHQGDAWIKAHPNGMLSGPIVKVPPKFKKHNKRVMHYTLTFSPNEFDTAKDWEIYTRSIILHKLWEAERHETEEAD